MYCPPPSVSSYACITHAGNKRKQRLEGEERPDRPKRTKEEPQNQKEKQKGLGANPGHKRSQNSHSPSDKTFCRVTLAPSGKVRSILFIRCCPLGVSCDSCMLRLHPLAGVHSIS